MRAEPDVTVSSDRGATTAPSSSSVTDPARVAALGTYGVLDTGPEAALDSLVQMAAQFCDAPVALVTLVDDARQFFKAREGFEGSASAPLEVGFCPIVVERGEPVVIPDTHTEHATNPAAREGGVRFYAGVPLRTEDGHTLGTLCVLDKAPRPEGLRPAQLKLLQALATQVVSQFELRRALARQDALVAEQERARREREILTRTGDAVALAGGDLDVILDAVTAGAMEAIPSAEGAAVELLVGDELEYRATVGALAPHRGLRVPLRDSLAAQCVLTGAPILAEDVLRDGQVRPYLAERLGLHSAVLAPIARGERVVGVLKLQAGPASAFAARDLALARLFAAAATAGLTEVAEAEAERARRRSETRLRLLARISAALITAEDPARAVEPILAAGAESLGFDQAYLYDLAPDRRYLALTHSVGTTEEVRAALAHADLDGPLCGIVAETRRPLVLEGVLATDAPRYALAREVGIDAFAGYPVTSRGTLVGVISFCASARPAFDAEALTFFETVARYLSGVRERLDGEAALRESDARSRLAQEAGRVGTFEVDVASGLMSVSAEFARLYGKPPTGLYSPEAFQALILPEDRHLASDEASREAGTSTPEVEYRIRRADDGAMRWIARRASFARDEAGRVLRMFGTVQDVTERHEAQAALGESEARFRTIVETIEAAFAIVQVKFDADDRPVDYRFVEANPAFERQAGVNLRGKWVTEFAPDLERFWFETYGRVARTGEPATFESYAEAFKRWFDVRAVRVGRPEERRIAIFFSDVTARKQAETDLRASEALARANVERVQLALAAGAIIGTWNWHLPTDRFTVDDAFARSFGLDPALGREGIPLAQIVATVHPDDQAGLADAINEAVSRSGAYAHQYRVRRADGRYYWIEANGRVDCAPDGTPLSFPGVLLDIEERRATERRRDALLALGDRLRDLGDVPALVQAAAEILAGVTGATRAGYGVVDAARETVDVPTDWCAPGTVSIAGLHDFRAYGTYVEDLKRGEVVAIDDATRDARTRDTADALLAIGARALLNVPVMEQGRLVGLAFVNHAQEHAYGDEDLAFVRTVADRVQIAVARVRAEERQEVLNLELSHRLKNTLAMVISIAMQTLGSVPDQAPVEAFESRLLALSSAHDVLLRQEWETAPLGAVAGAVLGNVARSERLRLSGPEISLGPRATLSVSLLLHELATNAAKYGALSNEVGRVGVTWRAVGEGDDADLVLDWEESGGPPVSEPSGRGFGSRLIRMGLVGTGGVALSYPPSGLRAEMRAPLAQLRHF